VLLLKVWQFQRLGYLEYHAHICKTIKHNRTISYACKKKYQQFNPQAYKWLTYLPRVLYCCVIVKANRAMDSKVQEMAVSNTSTTAARWNRGPKGTYNSRVVGWIHKGWSKNNTRLRARCDEVVGFRACNSSIKKGRPRAIIGPKPWGKQHQNRGPKEILKMVGTWAIRLNKNLSKQIRTRVKLTIFKPRT